MHTIMTLNNRKAENQVGSANSVSDNVDFYANNPDYMPVHEPIQHVIDYLQKVQDSQPVFA